MKNKVARLVFITSSFFIMQSVSASSLFGNDATTFPEMPHFSAWGYTNIDDGNGNGEVVIPNIGNNSHMLYTDVQGRYGTSPQGNGWFAGLGEGYRAAISNSQLLGGYLFVDRNQTQSNSIFWVVSPGVETVGTVWDGRVNGYIPVGSQENKLGSTTGSNLGIYTNELFSGHNAYDTIYNYVEETGPGVDAEVGRIFPSFHNLHAYVGGYFYAMPATSNITGAEARIEYPVINHFSILAADTFDNLNHNTFMLGVKVDVGGGKPGSKDIEDHLLDNVDRHLGNLDMATSMPTEKTYIKTNSTVLTNSNVWFFNSNGLANQSSLLGDTNPNGSIAANSCTAENPCNAGQFNQTNINQINTLAPNAVFYMAPGTYSPNTNLTINAGQSIYGRNSTFQIPAYIAGTSDTISGALTLNGNNTIDSMSIMNNGGTQNYGISITNASNITLSHDTIGALNSSTGYSIGISLNNASNVTISNSIINAFGAVGPDSISNNAIVGVEAQNNANFILTNDTINATVSSNVDNASLILDAINTHQSTGVITGTTVNDNANISGNSATVTDQAVVATGGSLNYSGNINQTDLSTGPSGTLIEAALGSSGGANVTSTATINSVINATGSASTVTSTVLNNFSSSPGGNLTYSGNIIENINATSAIIERAATNGGALLTITNSNITLNANSSAGSVSIMGIRNTADGSVSNISNDTFNLTSTATSGTSTIAGLITQLASGSTINANNNIFNLRSTSGNSTSTVTGISAAFTGTTINATGNTFNMTAQSGNNTAGSATVIGINAIGSTQVTATSNIFNMTARLLNGTVGTYTNTTGAGTIVNTNNTFNQN